MAATPSTMLELGTALPTFRLPDFNGKPVSPDQFKEAGAIVVAFICPHCPFVRHIRNEFSRFALEYRANGLAVIAINSNDRVAYPDDGPDGMKKEAEEVGYVFPYLVDEDQSVAKTFRAACTPDFFLFDRNRKLAYRGQFDDSRPSTEIAITGSDLRAAADAVLANRSASANQKPSVGCNIKWKPGQAPEYYSKAAI